MTSRYPFSHPEIVAVLDEQHEVSRRDLWRSMPALPLYFWAKLTGHAKDDHVRHRVYHNLSLAVTPERGAVLYLIARAIRATRIVEFGSSFGVSTIYLATAARDNAQGQPASRPHVIGSEMEEYKLAVVAKNLNAAGLSNVATVLPGDALKTLEDVQGPIDMAFLDGRKDLYLRVLKLLQPKLRDGAVVIADNIFSFKKEVADFLDYVRSGKNGFVSAGIKVSDGMEFSVYRK
jgi:predicted O-methyltransferase YrrM